MTAAERPPDAALEAFEEALARALAARVLREVAEGGREHEQAAASGP